MEPEAVGAPAVLGHEAVGRLPGGDPRPPADWEDAEVEAVVDQGPGAHLDRPGVKDLEAQPGGRQLLEVAGVGEEGEDLLARPGHPGRGAEFEDPHRAPAPSNAARISSILFRFTPKSLRPRREAERKRICLVPSSKTNSTSSTKRKIFERHSALR